MMLLTLLSDIKSKVSHLHTKLILHLIGGRQMVSNKLQAKPSACKLLCS